MYGFNFTVASESEEKVEEVSENSEEFEEPDDYSSKHCIIKKMLLNRIEKFREIFMYFIVMVIGVDQ